MVHVINYCFMSLKKVIDTNKFFKNEFRLFNN